MSRTLLVILALALAASPVVAQHGPPPGYTDPTVYAQDYAAREAAAAQADPVGYAQGADPAAEAEHAAWLACWTAYEAAGPAVDAACSRFFTAPGTVDPQVEEATAEVTEVLNETGVTALGDEVVDAVSDTLADPASALQQAGRIVSAAVRFVKDLLETVLDLLGLGALAVAAGLLGAAQGLLQLLRLPVEGLALASAGVGDVAHAIASLLGLAGTGLTSASLAAADGVMGAADAVLGAAAAAATGIAQGVAAVAAALGSVLAATGQGLADATQAAGQGAVDAAQATARGLGDAADAVRDTVGDVVDKVGALFGGDERRPAKDAAGLPGAPRTGTEADGLVDRLLDSL